MPPSLAAEVEQLATFSNVDNYLSAIEIMLPILSYAKY